MSFIDPSYGRFEQAIIEIRSLLSHNLFFFISLMIFFIFGPNDEFESFFFPLTPENIV